MLRNPGAGREAASERLVYPEFGKSSYEMFGEGSSPYLRYSPDVSIAGSMLTFLDNIIAG
jgi:hypothetical protein